MTSLSPCYPFHTNPISFRSKRTRLTGRVDPNIALRLSTGKSSSADSTYLHQFLCHGVQVTDCAVAAHTPDPGIHSFFTRQKLLFTSSRSLMASALHAIPYPQAPSPFGRPSTSQSMHAEQLSQPPLGSFEASQSIASTPAATPPPRGSSQQQHSFNMASNGLMNGSAQRASFGSYPEPNGYGHQAQPQYSSGGKPQIYTVCLPEAHEI